MGTVAGNRLCVDLLEDGISEKLGVIEEMTQSGDELSANLVKKH
jgi:hypothetical protein